MGVSHLLHKRVELHSRRGTFEILAVRPAQPLENSPIAIEFRMAPLSEPLDGWVEYRGVADGSRPGAAPVRVETGKEIRGTVYGLAPAAGTGVPVVLQFHKNIPGVEFPPVDWETQVPINVEASYTVGIDWFEVGNPRNGPDTAAVPASDLVIGTCSAKLGDQLLPRPNSARESPEETADKPITHDFGRHTAKSVTPTRFQFGPFGGVPGSSPDLALSFALVNSGYAGSSVESAKHALDWLSDVGKVVGQATVPGLESVWDSLHSAIGALHDAMFANCDGPVAADKIVWPSILLERLTSELGDYAEVRHYPGSNSPVACGKTSNYYVRFLVNRVSSKVAKVVCGPYGGHGGAPFEERAWPDSTITGIVIRAGARVDAIQLVFSNQRVIRHGGTGGSAHEVTLAEGEYIWGISGRSGDRLDAISIHTNQRVIGPFGGRGGTTFSCGDPSLRLAGIFGRSGKEVDAIGALFRQA